MNLQNLNDYLLVDMDCRDLRLKGSKCDYLWVGVCHDRDWVVPIELQAKVATAQKATKQLQGGANFADGCLPHDARVEFQPIAFYRGRMRRDQRQDFYKKASRIEFRQRNYEIDLCKCGDSLEHCLV